ncbi:MAG: ATPase [Rhodopirellula sp.]|nr:ATPase [Rhodopirellula sp.]
MKIAIPTAGGRLCSHFGHCEQFAMVEVDEARRQILQTSYSTPPAHEPGVLPKWLYDQGVHVVISGGMGRRASEFFRILGIRVVVGAPAETPEQVAAAFLSGSLVAGENPCDH